MFGKRINRENRGHLSLCFQPKAKIFFNKKFVASRRTGDILQNSIQSAPIFVNRKNDNRPFISIDLLGTDITALLDSGANNSIIGANGIDTIKSLGLKVFPSHHGFVTTADGSRQKVVGYVDLPLCINNSCKVISPLIVPTVSHPFIFGSDFCRKFQIKIDFRNNFWEVRQNGATQLSVVGSQSSSADNTSNLIVLEELNKDQKLQVQSVVKEFKQLGDRKLGRTNRMLYSIDTGEAKPFKQRQYLMSPYMLRHLNSELDRMLALGVVEPSRSAWSSPVLLVKKSNGDFRFCFDGRKLNSITKKDSYPLPYVDRILNMLRDASYISSVDLRSAFWQIPLDQESKEKTAFSIPGRGLFHFNVVPFGLTNAAQCQQRLMEAVFGPELEPNIFVYLDDIIVVSSSFDEHIKLLREIIHRLREANLTVNFEKCEFFRPHLKYLGFVVGRAGLRTDPDKVTAMVNFPKPKTTTEIKRFVGMCSWYRRFIPHFSTLMSPINDLLKGRKKGQKITWTNAADKAFCDIKQELVSAPILVSPDFSLPFSIQCDASDTGLGCVLTQEQNGQEKVIAFASRSLSKSERNYSVTERECLACVFGCEKFRPYVEGAHFTVITDHASLKWLFNMRDLSGRLARWSVRLNQFNFNIEHRKGKFNVVPDALSRSPVESALSSGNVEVADVDPDNVISLDIDLSRIDSFYKNLRTKILSNPDKYPQWSVKNGYVYKCCPSKLPSTTNVSDWKLLVPRTQRQSIFESSHDAPTAAHLGFVKTLERIATVYYWPRMRRDIFRYVKNCKVCASQKSPNHQKFGLMGAEKKCRFPWQIIALDLIGPLPRSTSGNEYLLVVCDWFTKYPLLCPLRKATSTNICRFLENEVFLVYGVPQYIICDNGRQLVSREIQDLVKSYKSKFWYTAGYHAQANFVERYNRTVCTAIRCYIKQNHKLWDREISKIGYALRTSVNEVTGYSPAFLNFGRFVPPFGDYYGNLENRNLDTDNPENWLKNVSKLKEIYEDVQEKIHAAHLRNTRYYNLRRRDAEFFVGDKVWRKNHVLSNASKNFAQKLAPRYIPGIIWKKKSKLVYVLKNENGSNAGVWHIQDLKPFNDLPSDSADSEAEE